MDLDALELDLRARGLSGPDPVQNRRATQLLREAVAADPDFAVPSARAMSLDPGAGPARLDGAWLAGIRGELAEAVRRVSEGLLLSGNLATTRYHVAYNLYAIGDLSRTRAEREGFFAVVDSMMAAGPSGRR